MLVVPAIAGRPNVNLTNHLNAAQRYLQVLVEEMEAGRLLEGPIEDQGSESYDASRARLAVFISHSSADTVLAAAIVRLFREALNLPPDQIRCTSVDGYRLPVGAQTAEELREEVLAARAVVAVVSDQGMSSAYVLFELGARWGAHRPISPIVALDRDLTLMRGPLSGINALSCEHRAQVLQLVTDLASALGIEPNAPAVFDDAVSNVVAVASGA